MDTKYAPAEREQKAVLNQQNSEISSDSHLRNLLDALPYVAAILNDKRQIIYCNSVLLKTMGENTIENIIGLRPGELLSCKNSKIEEGGCGTSENCKYCGAINAIITSQTTGDKTSMECRISTEELKEPGAYDLLATATPFTWKNAKYTILSLNDISDEKRRRALEKIFFHDIINKAGSLSSYIDLVKDINDPKKLKEFLSMVGVISNELTEEILSQRQLLAAENNELHLSIENIEPNDILNSVANSIMHHYVAKGKKIVVLPSFSNIVLLSDHVLLKRILTNMLKNALEASKEGDEITLKCEAENDFLCFSVNNPGVIPDVIQKQLFQRSFSTKGTDRGLGTYSMKLLGEKFLKGKVWFNSNEHENTTFYLKLPLQLK